MEQALTSLVTPAASAAEPLTSSPALRSTDHWQRRFGVPWDRVDRAARAVLDRAAAASGRRFASLTAASTLSADTRAN